MKNIFTLLLHMSNYIKNKKVEKGKINNVTELKEFMKQPGALFLPFMNLNGTHYTLIRKIGHLGKNLHSNSLSRFLIVTFIQMVANLKTNLQKLLKFLLLSQQGHPKKYWKSSNSSKKEKKSVVTVKPNNKYSYVQAVNSKINNILKLKKDYPNLLAKKIKIIHKIINDSNKLKPKIKMTTKDLPRKQIILPIGNKDKIKFMASSGDHVVIT